MKKTIALIIHFISILGIAASTAFAEPPNTIRPITNPVHFDTADVGTFIHPIFIHQNHPSRLNTALGKVPAGGDFQLYALQFEVQLAENLSLIAVKDGYIDFNPDETLSEKEGMADLGAGLKYVIKRSENSVVSVKTVVEFPIGDDEVWQGNGDGTINPAITGLKLIDGLQLQGTVGGIVALDDADSSLFYNSWHASYALTDKFFPLVELHHFRVVDEGDGGERFKAHVDGGVPGVAYFEGGDLVNLGASNSDDNADIVTLGLGARLRLSDSIDFGAAYEFPLTDKEDGLMEDRITLDLVIRL